MKLFFDDASFDSELQRTAAKASYGCADLGEVFAIAARITPADLDSWYRAWFAAGVDNRDLAESEASRGNVYTATQAFLRASEYFRSAYFYTRRDYTGDALQDAWRASREAFWDAIPHLPVPTERVQIPFEGMQLPGYLFLPPDAAAHTLAGDGGLPVLIFPAGYDGPAEETYSLGAVEAAMRGFAVLTFDGPGQGEMLYAHRVPFRFDFETVVAAAIDVVAARDGLDASRLGIVGRSFGGYLAPRAAANEPRIAAMTADPAQLDMGAAFATHLPRSLLDMLHNDDPAFNDAIWEAYPGVVGQEYWLSRARSHGCDTPLEYVKEMAKYTVDVSAIACPTFVSYGEGDFAQSDSKTFYDRLTVENKRFVMYRDADGGGGHCEGMGPSRFFADAFGWLAGALST
ncbi:alpha/beta fold hydrolase [Microbacterium awajiense]|uniref:Alpha/beta fold hydrolase n=1 Tax=Microbacterium awajiense TaxID=415214 RepID=A0ABP7ANT5_9MICO